MRHAGPIIHNRDVIAYLESIGVGLVDTPEEVPPGTAVLIRSHGRDGPSMRRWRAWAGRSSTPPAQCVPHTPDRLPR